MFSAAARSIAANYGWFIAVVVSGVACLAIAFAIYWIHRQRKDVQERPKEPKSKFLALNSVSFITFLIVFQAAQCRMVRHIGVLSTGAYVVRGGRVNQMCSEFDL